SSPLRPRSRWSTAPRPSPAPPPATSRTRSPPAPPRRASRPRSRSEEHTSELQSLTNLVCRLLLEKKKTSSSHVSTLKTDGSHPHGSSIAREYPQNVRDKETMRYSH